MTAGELVMVFIGAALVNILENAVDACREDIETPHHRIDFRVYAEGHDILFDIADNGVGMNEEVLSQAFALFFSSKATQGTGIGLFITRKIIHQHGGEIAVRSQPGQGALFQIRIPAGPSPRNDS